MSEELDFTSYLEEKILYIDSRLKILCEKVNRPDQEIINNSYDWLDNLGSERKEKGKIKVDLSNEIYLGFLCNTFSLFRDDFQAKGENMDVQEALDGFVNIQTQLVRLESQFYQDELQKEADRANGQLAWKNSQKTKEKYQVKELWLEWKKNPARYKNKSRFARDMLDKFENLDSQKTITDVWIPTWEKELNVK